MAEFKLVDSIGYTHKLTVTEKTQDIITNTTTIRWEYTLTSGSNNGFSKYGIGWEVYINGVQVAYHAKVSGEYTCLKGGNILTFGNGTVTIEHSADGSKSIDCYARAFNIDQSVNYTPDNDIKPSGTMTLTKINRGLVYIDNGTTLEPYLCYIDNGTTWVYYRPYIDNGTDFIEYG
jgi:hypothetical protein